MLHGRIGSCAGAGLVFITQRNAVALPGLLSRKPMSCRHSATSTVRSDAASTPACPALLLACCSSRLPPPLSTCASPPLPLASGPVRLIADEVAAEVAGLATAG